MMLKKHPICFLRNLDKITLVAIGFLIATFVASCGNKKIEEESLDLNKLPRQVIDNMAAVQTSNGVLQMRMEAKLMQRFENDSSSYELFPKGFDVYAYNKEGELETHIRSNIAHHTKYKNNETWEAFGDVLVKNFIKGERMETDTLYWDRVNQKIYTHTFVKLYSPQGFMQGFGMESYEMARNAIIIKPFDSFGIVENDSTKLPYIDTVNFIGPLLLKKK